MLLHHLVVGLIAPQAVFGHAGGQVRPLPFTAVHTVAIAAQYAFAVTQWHVHERALVAERTLAQQLLERENALREYERREQVYALAAGVAHAMNTPVQYASDNARFLGAALAELDLLLEATATDLALVQAGGLLPEQAGEKLTVVLDRHRRYTEEWTGEEVDRALADCLDGLARLVVGLRAEAEGADAREPGALSSSRALVER